MSPTTSRQRPNTGEATAEEDLPPQGAPDDGVAGQGAAAIDGPVDGEKSDAAEGGAAEGGAAEDEAAEGGGVVGVGAGDATSGAVAGGARWSTAAARAAALVTTVLAAVFVLSALLLPNQLTRLTPYAFTRIPVEAILGATMLLALSARKRRAAAVFGGVLLALLTLLKFLDMGFYSTLDRPFDMVLDWELLGDAQEFLGASVGRTGAIGAVIGVALLVLAFLALMPLAVLRVTGLMVRHRVATTRTTWAAGMAWITCAALGVQIGGVPVTAKTTVTLVHNRAYQVRTGLAHEREFGKKAAVDAFRSTPSDQLLTGLRGKDVIFAFVESYGRNAVQDPGMAPQVSAVLADGTKRLRDAGYSSRSAFLTSPVTGARSWMAHSTFLSGLWIKNQQRYRNLTSSDRLTLTGAFQRTNAWRTVGIVPGVRRAWPEGEFFRLDHIYDSRNMGYKGPSFTWTPVPDQYSLAAFERLEHGRNGPKPLMTEIILASSHNPWAPIPRMIGWDEVGDGSIYHAIKREGKRPEEVWKDPAQVRVEYRRAIEYSLRSLLSYVEKYGKKDTVLVFLGDHQPVPTVVGHNASRDVPISIVARDPKVMDRISGWGWQDGLKPGPKAPVWRMDTFRDRFLTAYSSRPGSVQSPPAR